MLDKLISKFFTKNNSNNEEKKNIIGGNIAYYNLTDWWLNEFTEDERNIIREKYKPIGCTKDYFIDNGEIEPIYSGCSQFDFLNGLYYWFGNEQEFYIRILTKSLEYNRTSYNDTTDIVGRHMYYLEQIKFHYANRQQDNHLDLAIEYCQKQIDISKEVKQAWFIKYSQNLHLPSHIGFKQLAIIYEKQEKYEEALELTKRCLEEGWNNDCEKRIERLEKKINKDLSKR